MARDAALQFLRELERADEDVAAVLAELDELARETASIGGRAVELEAFLFRLPAERERIGAEIARAAQEVDAGTAALARAEKELAAAERKGDAESLASARRAKVRMRDALTIAERRAERGREERDRLEREAEAAALEAD
ncbi:MAG: hypothetical protein M3312_09810, partial [Actinomycetota bacterium]|nr:hypothetical protein [Actinomycetota bacterium]